MFSLSKFRLYSCFRRCRQNKTKRKNYAFDLDPNPLYGDSNINATSSVFILRPPRTEVDQGEKEDDYVIKEGEKQNCEELESTYNRLSFAKSDFRSQLYNTLRFSTESDTAFPATSGAGDYDHIEKK